MVFCKNCVHLHYNVRVYDKDGKRIGACGEICKFTRRYNIVTGESEYNSCQMERNEGGCGIDGLNFKQKEEA